MNKEKIKVEIYTNANRAFEDEADEILKDKDKKAIINILKQNFDLEDSLLDLESLQEEIEKLKKDLKKEKENKHDLETNLKHLKDRAIRQDKWQRNKIERLNNIIVKLKKVLWKRCEEARKNEQYVRLNCYKDILNELVNTIYEVDGETNKEW